LTIENIHQLLAWQPEHRESIIEEGILLPNTVTMVFGQPKAWKTMLSLHTAFTIATGSTWFGFKTAKSATFKYQAELPKAIDRNRVEKYSKGADSYPDNIFFKTPQERVKLDTSWGAAYLNKDVAEVKSRCPNQHLVLILDPLYKFLAGHISDEYDVKRFQDNLDEIKLKQNISIIIIHHSHKTRIDASGNIVDLGPEEAMGSSYFNNWCDTMMRARLLNPYTGSNIVEVTFELTRNAESVLPFFQVRWDRATLQPTVIKRGSVELTDEPTVKGLIEGGKDE